MNCKSLSGSHSSTAPHFIQVSAERGHRTPGRAAVGGVSGGMHLAVDKPCFHRRLLCDI